MYIQLLGLAARTSRPVGRLMGLAQASDHLPGTAERRDPPMPIVQLSAAVHHLHGACPVRVDDWEIEVQVSMKQAADRKH